MKKNSYLVYDNDNDTSEPNSLRDIFEQEEQDLPPENEPTPEDKKEKNKRKEKPVKEKNPKKLIEKFFIGLIAVTSLAIIGVLTLFFLGRPEEILINAEQQTERALFDYTAEYSQKINGYFYDIKDLLIKYRDGEVSDITKPLDEIKTKVEVSKEEFVEYKIDYTKNDGKDVFDIYVSRLLNLSKLIDELYNSVDAEDAISINNERVIAEKEYVEDSKAFIKKWLNDNGIPFKVVDDKIILE